jgi:hypothetical protein
VNRIDHPRIVAWKMLPDRLGQTTISELMIHIFGDQPHALAAQLADWMASSTRFKTFVTIYRDKIRKKIRGMRDAEGLRDLLLELETAYILLQERRFIVEYEKYGVGKARGPDFAVTFRTNIIFNVEVTRMRSFDNTTASSQSSGVKDGLEGDDLPLSRSFPPLPISDKQYEISKLIDTVCGKLGQMLAGMINVLLVVVDDGRIDDIDVMTAMARLQERAGRKELEFFARKGFSGAQEFFKYYHRLSGVLVRSPLEHGASKHPILWVNTQARRPIPTDLRAILQK